MVPGRRCFEFDFRWGFFFHRMSGDVFDVCAFLLSDFFFLCSQDALCVDLFGKRGPPNDLQKAPRHVFR